MFYNDCQYLSSINEYKRCAYRKTYSVTPGYVSSIIPLCNRYRRVFIINGKIICMQLGAGSESFISDLESLQLLTFIRYKYYFRLYLSKLYFILNFLCFILYILLFLDWIFVFFVFLITFLMILVRILLNTSFFKNIIKIWL